MKRNLLISLLLLVSSNIKTEPKNKTFQNIFVNESTNTQFLNVDEGARIGGNLLVKGNSTIVGNLDVSGTINGGNISGGGIVGPSSSTINAVSRWANTTGDVLKDSSVLVDDLGNITINGITKNSNTVAWPTIVGAAGTFLSSDGLGNLVYATPAGGGNVSTTFDFTTDSALIRVDLASGVHNIKESNVILDNADNMTGLNSVTATTFNGALNGNATTATTSTSFSGSLAGDVTGNQTTTVVSAIGNGAVSAAQVISGTNAANAATPTNTPNTIVERDGTGSFQTTSITATTAMTAPVFNGALNGNASTATSSTTTVNFTGSLAGDVSGTQGHTQVDLVGGQLASAVANATSLANAATNIDTPSTIVRRDGSGNFSAGTITAALHGNADTATTATSATTATTATTATNFTGSLAGDVTGNQSSTVVNSVGNGTVSAAAINTSVQDTTNATPNDIINTIVKRDGFGNFSAGTITAALNGNANTATTATTSTNFSGSLAGDVIGNQTTTVVNAIGNGAVSAAQVISATNAANAATPTNTPNTIVERDGTGSFQTTSITATTAMTAPVFNGALNGNASTATSSTTTVNFTGSLAGDVSGTQGHTQVDLVGGQLASAVANATSLANAATNIDTPSTIVRRDGSGNFSAGTITAALHGNADTATTATSATTATTATTATNFTGSLAGDVTGNQSSTVVNSVGNGLVSAAAINTSVQATTNATSNNTANTIVKRDGLGDFTTNMITITGTTTNPTDVATKDYVDSVAGLGLEPKTPAQVVSTTNVALSGLQTIDSVTLVDGDRVLLVNQTNPVENGLWVAHAGAWTRPTDFASGTQAGQAYVLILSGTVNGGSSWLCNTPTAIIDTNPISFVEFSLPSQTTAANVGTGAGQIFRDKTGQTINLKTIAAGPHMVVTNNTNDITLSTDATSANTPGTIVARDVSGDFAANQITANNFVGFASLTGATMTGNLVMDNQSQVVFEDATNTGSVGIFAPTSVPSSYSFSLPASAPIVGQFLQATSASSTQWATVGGTPAVSKTYYVALNGSDSNDGSFSSPFLTVSHAVSVANGVASQSNPIAISIGAGIFVENNTGGPITITADGINLLGTSIGSTFIIPMSTTNNLFNITTPNVSFADFTMQIPFPGSTASAINLAVTVAGTARFTSIGIGQFQTGIMASSTSIDAFILLSNIQTAGNGTGISLNNIQGVIENGLMQGPLVSGSAVNTGISITGTDSQVAIFSSALKLFETGISISGGAGMRVLSTDIENSTNGISCTGASDSSITGCSFIFNTASSVNITASGANTTVVMEACNFDCKDVLGNPQGTAIKVITGANLALDSCAIKNAALGIQCGQALDTISTAVRASGAILQDCTADILQNGTSTLNFFAGVVNENKITINDPTNVSIAAFNENAELVIGTGADTSHTIYEMLNGQVNGPNLQYQPNYYGFQGTVYENPNANAVFNGTQSQSNDAAYYVITGSRTNTAGINLISDTGNFGVSDFVRGWNINKIGTSANLTFNYSNNDTSGQAARGSNTVMQLNGLDNQVEFPLATNAPLPTNTIAKLVWGGDTTLYRSSASVLKTDGNLIVGGLTPQGVVHNDATGLLSTSLIVNDDISILAGITDNKLATITTPGKVANSATTATSSNTPDTIVLRDGSGNFTANQITAVAGLIGAASLNVLKAGDTMTGNLNMANQSQVRFEDATNTGFVGLFAPTSVPSSYSVSLPASAPSAGQVLQATSSSATQWSSIGGIPSTAETIYVAKNGSDSNNGTLTAPYLTIKQALITANSLASASNPIVIRVGPGLYVEDNSGGPLTITANAISIVGSSTTGTIVIPSTLSNDLFRSTTSNFLFFTISMNAIGVSTANAFTLVAGAGQGAFQSVVISGFQTGLSLSGSGGTPVVAISTLLPLGNGTAMTINNARVVVEDSIFLGNATGSTPANSGISITGTNSLVTVLGCSFRLFTNGITISGGSNARVLGTNFEAMTNGIIANGSSTSSVVGCNFVVNNASSIDIAASGANTTIDLDGCNIDGKDALGNVQGTALQCTTAASIVCNGTTINNVVLGIQCGTAGDTSTTAVTASATNIRNSTTDINQVGTSTLRFTGGVFDTNKITIANATNVNFAAFDRTNNQALTIGDDTDVTQTIFQILNGQANLPSLVYSSNYYGNKGTVYQNLNADPTFTGLQAQSNDASHYVVTGSRTNSAGINLISDTGNFGVSDNVRGWSINKVGTSANLTFNYSNNDTSGQAARGLNTVMQLNGFDNQVEFPLATNAPLPTNTVAKLIWAGDTTLYRNSASVLKTDGALIVGALTANRAVITNASNQLASSTVTDTELGFLSGVTSSIQTQLNNKVSRSGDTMTGTLTLPAQTAAVPSLQFTGSTNTGLSAPAANILSFSTNGVSRMSLSSAGVTIPSLTPAGVVHNDVNGLLSSSLIVNADVSPSAAIAYSKLNLTDSIVNADINSSAAIVDTKLATISTPGKVANTATTATTANTPNTIVLRDGSGNISGNITGSASLNVLKAGDTMTGTLILPAGTTGVPSLQFTGSTNTGISAATANTISISTAGVERLRIDANGNTTYKSNYKLNAYLSANQGVNNTTATIIFNTETIDPNANYNTATGIYTAPFTGTYLVSVGVTAQTANQPATQTVNIIVNGSAVTGSSVSQLLNVNNARQSMTTCTLLNLNAGDSLRVDYTTNKNDTIVANDTHMAIHFMSF